MSFYTTLKQLGRIAVDVALSATALFLVTILPQMDRARAAGDSISQEVILRLTLYSLFAGIALWITRSYRMMWRFVSFRDFLRLVAAAVLAVGAFAVCVPLLHLYDQPLPEILFVRLILLMAMANIGLLAAPRFVARAMHELLMTTRKGTRNVSETQPEMILLTGDAERMEAFIRDCVRDPASRYCVAGVLSDDARLHGSYFHGVQVLGGLGNMADVLKHLNRQDLHPKTLVVAADNVSRGELARILELATSINIKVGRLPPLGSFTDGAPVRPLELRELLGRSEIKIDIQPIAGMVKDLCVMVTGGGGSIGSELCRQIASLKPSKLVVLDSSEFNLYSIDAELNEKHPNVVRETALVDVRDAALVSRWIANARPAIVFHAAALKHVPLLEDHPIEGIKTNVFGTANVAEACRLHGVPTMVMISTDKAVNPTNVMGATKRLAEAYCQGLDLSQDVVGGTRFVMVRFGNVLGSAGSVVPLFRRQVEAGGPVTVTHPDVTRYFMTIPEAVTLVMMAGAQGKSAEGDRGNIYLLDMGEPVKIVDLAREIIRLSGRRPDIDIKIEIIGLRPGEKLFEELNYQEEFVQPTASKSIFKLMPRATDLRIVRQQLQELRHACANEDHARALRLLKISVPDYITDAKAVVQS